MGSKRGVVRAIASRDPAVAKAWAREFGIATALGSYEAIVADPDIDAVYVPLPNELHEPWVCAAADAGKHVLCEKPLALVRARGSCDGGDLPQARRDLDGSLHVEAPGRTRRVWQMVRDGMIGELRLIRSSFSFPIGPSDWRLDPARGGGALWDVGCYGVSTARLFAGEEPCRFGSLARFGPSGVDQSLTSMLEFPSGVLAVIDCSFEQPFRCHYELSGTARLDRRAAGLSARRRKQANRHAHPRRFGQERRQPAPGITAPRIRGERPVRGDG